MGYHFGGPINKDYSILGSILGSPYFGKLPYIHMHIYELHLNKSIGMSCMYVYV